MWHDVSPQFPNLIFLLEHNGSNTDSTQGRQYHRSYTHLSCVYLTFSVSQWYPTNPSANRRHLLFEHYCTTFIFSNILPWPRKSYAIDVSIQFVFKVLVKKNEMTMIEKWPCTILGMVLRNSKPLSHWLIELSLPKIIFQNDILLINFLCFSKSSFEN